ncbi:MAG: sigma 54-interacting transcriptional regulator [Acidobacteriota bacterium]
MSVLCVTVDPGGRPRRYELGERALVIGSAPDSDVVVESPHVSARHARVCRTGDAEVEVRDLGSLNGTRMAGERILRHRGLPPFEFQLGAGVVLLVHDIESRELALTPEVDLAGRARERTTAPRAVGATEPTLEIFGDEAPDALALVLLRVLADTSNRRLVTRRILDAAVAQAQADAALLVRHSAEGDGASTPLVVDAIGTDMGLPVGIASRVAGFLVGDVEEACLDEVEPPVLLRRVPTERHRTALVILGARRTAVPLETLSLVLAVGLQAHRGAAPSSLRGQRKRFELTLPNGSVFESRSGDLLRLHRSLDGALTSDLPVLLTGETGVGKEVYARALHEQSTRASGPLRSINSSAIPEGILEAMLFGSRAGVATGVGKQEGLLAASDGGTFFFDEIGEMSPTLQAKLLRVLDQKEVLPVGASAPVPIDVRFVAATNRHLPSEIEAGRFRKDLYYRLCGHELRIPPLRDRKDDIPALVDLILRDECEQRGRHVAGVSLKAMDALVGHQWPGNVRELETLIRRLAHEVADGEPIRHAELPSELRAQVRETVSGSLDERLAEVERELIEAALERLGGNVAGAARALGVTRGRLRRLLEKHELEDSD